MPLHRVELSSDIVSGTIVVGLRPSLPVEGVSLILGNDVAGGKVEVNLCVSDRPDCDVVDPVGAMPGLFPACAVTRAMARKEMQKTCVEHICDESTSDIVVPSSVDQVEQEVYHNLPEGTERKKIQNLQLSPMRLVEEQKQDPELQRLREQAVSEIESRKVPVCYFVKDDVLMRK